MMKREKRRKLHQDNRGGAMVMVLVIIAFITILAGVLMFAAYAGYNMRIVDRHGKDNFYTAETVLDEINVGLQGEASAALNDAYQQVMTNYAVYETESARAINFYSKYFKELETRLADPSATGQYDIGTLRGYLSSDILGDGKGGSAPTGDRADFGTYGAIVESNVDSGTPYKLKITTTTINGTPNVPTGLALEDLKVSYVDESGYVSIISTDIRIAIPNMDFGGASAYPDLDGYCLIADNKLFFENSLGGTVTVKGDAYAGNAEKHIIPAVETKNDPTREDKGEETAIYIDTFGDVCFTTPVFAQAGSLSRLVGGGDVEVARGKLKTTDVELWGENLLLNASSADLTGSTNLSDDLVLNGIGSSAVLSGEYNGFGVLDINEINTPGSGSDFDLNDTQNADSSSAIMVNGKDCRLDLSGLEQLIVGGHSYVKTSTKATEDTNKRNVMMGESIAVKSNQLIYLVPPEALGCRIAEDGTIEETEFGCNPLKLEQYEKIINNPSEYLLLDGHKQIEALDYKSLDNYINQETVAGKSEPAYIPEVVFKQTNAGTLVYCYLRFKDEEAANRYFRDYYNVNTETVNKYTRLYATEIKMADADAMLYLNMAGNALAYTGAAPAEVVRATDSYGNRAQRQDFSVIKQDTYEALKAKMITNKAQLGAAELDQTVFPNIINETRLSDTISKLSSGGRTVKISTEDGTKTVVLTEDDYSINSSTGSDVHMVISLGNVTVERSFEGLVIAKGNITVKGAVNISPLGSTSGSAVDEFTEMLNAHMTSTVNGNEYYVLDVFRDGVNELYGTRTVESLGSERVSMADLINYERWTKK